MDSARRNPGGARQRRAVDETQSTSKNSRKKHRKDVSQADGLAHATLFASAGTSSSRKAKYARAVAQLEEARRERRNRDSLYNENIQKLSQQSVKVLRVVLYCNALGDDRSVFYRRGASTSWYFYHAFVRVFYGVLSHWNQQFSY